jgi:hypothetical protein
LLFKDFGYQVAAVYWLLVSGCWLLVTGYRFLPAARSEKPEAKVLNL